MSRLHWYAAAAACLSATPAVAADTQDDTKATVAATIARACFGQAGKPITPTRIAMALLAETEVGIGQVSEDAALASVVSPNRLTGRSPDQRNRLRAARDQLLNDLARPSSSAALAIIVAPKPPAPREPTHDFVFRPDPGYTFTCATAAADTLTRTPEINTLVIRKGADELSKVGEEIKSAGSAQLVFDDFRTTNLAGEEKRTVKLIVNAAAGLAIPGIARSANQHLFAYAEYSRSRVRVRTSPVSATPEDDGSADDVDALEVGLLGTALLGNVVQTNGRIGYIDDAITGARYLAGGLALSPKTAVAAGWASVESEPISRSVWASRPAVPPASRQTSVRSSGAGTPS